MNIFDKPTPKLTDQENAALLVWSGVKLDTHNVLEIAGAVRNVERWAQSYGVKVLAQLLASGKIPPMSDPCEMLDDLLSRTH